MARTGREQRRRRFGAALAAAMETVGVSQTALAASLGRAQSTVSTWVAGDATPLPDVVFGLERELEVPPGWLSRHLGYVPTSATDEPVIEAIQADGRLSDEQRSTLIGMLREFTGCPPSKRSP